MTNYRNITLKYYDEKALNYKNEKNELDYFEEIYNNFTTFLQPGCKILDFGCGTGRDCLYFKKNGYNIVGLDGSRKMCEITRELCHIEVKEILFEDFKEENEYDGIWACASLLHLPYDVLINVLSNLAVALKENGYIYTTFKYGNFEGIRNERYFTDMTEEIFNTIIKNIPSLELVKTYYNESNIKKQKNKLWINFILKKVS